MSPAWMVTLTLYSVARGHVRCRREELTFGWLDGGGVI
jgi:hypothetical protein